jgi:hypothetical protein
MKRVLPSFDELGHSSDAFLDWHIRIDARHAKDVERIDSKIFQALLAGLTEITRIASAAHGVWATVAWAAALRVDDNIMSTAADCFADQAVIVPLAVAGRRVEKIDPEIERAPNSGDRLSVIRRTIDPRHAVTAETDG